MSHMIESLVDSSLDMRRDVETLSFEDMIESLVDSSLESLPSEESTSVSHCRAR